ncbi:hypothetical protein CEJ45_23300 [Herbaspirillum aquaticum]|uniref:Uncharacterized protein n=2 Tax=Herbaspirillum aquaticum TaxID=568783 RepID=A0A225SM18_9BURK|nr:hypothetical protein CEJ45_23300 [Herbaspirillum aquaticum]
MFVLGSIFTVLLSKVFFNKLTHHEWLSEKIKGETASACTNLGSLATIGFFLKPYAFTGLGFLGVAMLLYLFALVV